MKSYFYISIVIFSFLFSCKNEVETTVSEANHSNQESKIQSKNLNISILLDLSDRIDPKKYPNPSMEFYQRDAQYIHIVANSFIQHLKSKKLILLNDKIGLYFSPEPSIPEINKISNELKISINKNSPKTLLQQSEDKYETLPVKIYESAIRDGNYVGSDIWRFFRDKVKDFCIEEDQRNILVILTDGYIYHKDSEIKQGNQTSYITPQLIRHLSLDKSDWNDKIINDNYGFIPATKDLNNLEVLVIGINPDNKNPFEGDVIKAYWENWFKQMDISKFKLLDTDLPSNLEKPISEFILNNN